MKTRILSALVFSSFLGLATGELKISKSIFRMDALDKAKAKAEEKEQPLVFVYTDPGTS